MNRFSKTWLIILILAILLPISVIQLATRNWETVLVFPLTTSFISALIIAWIAGGNKLAYLRMFFWIYAYIMFGISALAQVSLNSWPWPGYYTSHQIATAYGVIWFGLLAYESGYFIRTRRNPDQESQKAKQKNQSLGQGYPGIKLAILSIIFSSITYGYLYSQEISIFTLRNDYSTQLLDAFGTIGYAVVLLFTQFLPLVTLLWIVTEYKSYPTRQSPRIVYSTAGLLLLLILFISSNPIIAPRWWFSSVFISLILLIYGKSRKLLFLIGLGIPLAYTLLFPYLDLFRSLDTFDRITSSSRSGYLENLVDGDFDSLQQIMNTAVYVDYEGITFGRQLLGVVAYWVPRGLWVDKPEDTGVMVAEYLGYPYTNLSSPLWAEGFINFGMFGVLLFLVSWGYISRFLDKVYQTRFLTPQPSSVWLLPTFYLLVPAQNLLIRGSLLVATLYISSPILILLVWAWIDKVTSVMTSRKSMINIFTGKKADLP